MITSREDLLKLIKPKLSKITITHRAEKGDGQTPPPHPGPYYTEPRIIKLSILTFLKTYFSIEN